MAFSLIPLLRKNASGERLKPTKKAKGAGAWGGWRGRWPKCHCHTVAKVPYQKPCGSAAAAGEKMDIYIKNLMPGTLLK